jgi:hypothetical protein
MGASTDEDDENKAYVVVPEDGDTDPSKELTKTSFRKGQTPSTSVPHPKTTPTPRPPPPPSSKDSLNTDLSRIKKRPLTSTTTPSIDFGGNDYHPIHDTTWGRTPFGIGDLNEGGSKKFLDTPKTPFVESPNPSYTFTNTPSTPNSQSTSSVNTETERQRMMETEGLGGVDRKANDSADMKRGGRRIPHSELQFDDFSLASLTSFPEKLRKFEKENGAA